PKVFWNAKFDIRMSIASEVVDSIPPEINEAQFAAYAVNPALKSYKLKPYAKALGYDDDDQKTLHKVTVTLRGLAKKVGWRISDLVEQDRDDDDESTGAVEPDYWLVQHWRQLAELCAAIASKGKRTPV